MNKHMSSITVALLLTVSVTVFTPVPAYASALDSLLAQTSQSTGKSSGSSGIFDILVGLLLGKLFGNVTSGSANTSTTTSKVLSSTSGTTTQQSSAKGDAIITTAKKYMGVPYVWGGDTPDGFDCSGYTQYVMKENGITLPRTAAEQFATGTAVDKANLKTGDLVFFTTYKPGASHVGFYIGDGKFINASSSQKQIAISSLDEPYFAERYLGARRYI